jgi:YHS domain-containing protein
MLTRRFFLGAAVAGPLIGMTSGAAQADEPQFFASKGAVIRGYDPVSYFIEGKPVKGSKTYALMWKGGTWHFANAKNRTAFEADPFAYAPQYGGYCAYAVSRGYTATTEPDAWRIHDGKLYLNHNQRVRTLWSRDIPGNVEKANANWPAVLRN